MKETKKHFKLVDTQTGETDWQGLAFDAEHAIDRAFYHEEPRQGVIYDIYRVGQVSLSSSIKAPGWIKVDSYQRPY